MIGLALSVLTVPGATPGVGAEPGGEVGEGQVVTWPFGTAPPAGVRQVSPLAGAGFWMPVVQSAFAGQFSDQDGTYVAGAGDELVFVSAELDTFDPPLGQVEPGSFPTALTLRFAGHAAALTPTTAGSLSGVAGSAYGATGYEYLGGWVVAIPDGAPVTLTATEGGFSQSVDLRDGDRVGIAPVVLYRDPAGPLGLDVQPSLAATLGVSTGSGRVSFPVTVKEAVLSFFRLDGPVPSTGLGSGHAFLWLSVSVGDGEGRAGQYYFDPVDPSTAATLMVPGRGGVADVSGPTFQGADENLAGIYGFVVPATMTSATLKIGSGSGQSVSFDSPDSVTPEATAVTATTAATFPLRFPPAARVPAAAATAAAGPTITAGSSGSTTTPSSSPSRSTPRTPPVSRTATGAGSSRRGGEGSDLSGVAVGAGAAAGGVAVIVAGLVVRRRRTKLVAPLQAGGGEVRPSGGIDTGPSDGAAVDGSELLAGVTAGDGNGLVAGDGGEVPLLAVRVLGRLEVEGATGPIRRRGVERALVVLAVNCDRAVASEELRRGLAQDELSEPSAATLRSELSRLRAVLPEGLLPDRGAGSGYCLAGAVQVDWVAFKALAGEARRSDGALRLAVARRALGLVRGPVLEGGGWHGIDRTVWEIEAAVESLATDAAGWAIEAGEAVVAGHAAAQGLLAVPGSPGLWQLRIRAAKAGSGENVTDLAERARLLTGTT